MECYSRTSVSGKLAAVIKANEFSHPPKIPQSFLRWYCKPDLLEDIEGDIEEDYNKRIQNKGIRSAKFYYWLDVIRFFRPFAVRNFFKTQTNNTMFRVNTKIAFRNIGKDKLYSFINITGLAIGIAACLIIFHYVRFQKSFDKFHTNAESIYRVNTAYYENGELSEIGMYCGHALGSSLGRDFPEIKSFTRVHPFYKGALMTIKNESEQPFQSFEDNVLVVENNFLDVFSFKLIIGDRSQALKGPDNILLTTSSAIKYFGTADASILGKVINLNGGWANRDFKVSGILEDTPENSHLDFDFLLPIEPLIKEKYTRESAGWGWTNFFVYVLLNENSSVSEFQAKIENMMHEYRANDYGDHQQAKLQLQPIADIHLHSNISDGDGEFGKTGNVNSIYFLSLIAVLILVIAWINFINLSTAKANERGIEVGIKKAIGAQRVQLIFQFLTESFWVNTLALLLAIALTNLLVPVMGRLVGINLSADLFAYDTLIILGTLWSVGPILAGAYPALIMSSFSPSKVLKGSKYSGKTKGALFLRKGLVVFQFAISTFLIAGTYAVYKQLNYMRNSDLGMASEQVLTIAGPRVSISLKAFEAFKNEVNNISGVTHFASSSTLPGKGFSFGTSARPLGSLENTGKRVDISWVDSGFTETYDIEILAGRDFSEAIRGTENGILVNESLIETFNLGSIQEAIGKRIISNEDTLSIRGVMKNHNWQTLHSSYNSTILLYAYARSENFSVRFDMADIPTTISKIQDIYTTSFPGNLFSYRFLDDIFNEQYEEDRQFGQIFNAFAAFAIVAACLGLFGLASFTISQRAKEVGIRKVLGASSKSITMLFSRNYILLILVSNIIAVPLTYFGVSLWLDNYAFTINIGPELFLLPILLLLFIAGTTISYQTIKASRSNPVDNLRYE